MIPYVINTVLSCLFMYMGTINPKKKIKNSIFIFLAILLPSIMAGARDISVGTDTSVYGIPYFIYALERNFLEYMLTAGGDALWLLFVYIVSLITTNVFWELFLIEFIILFFTYKALVQYNLGKYTWIGFLVFHMMFYSFTLNLMRQFVCLSIILYSFKYVKQSQLKKYLLICGILFAVQKTSVVAIALYPMYHFMTERSKNKAINRTGILNHRLIYKGLIIICVCLLVVFAEYWIVLVSNVFGEFSSQIKFMNDEFDFVWRILVYLLPIYAIMMMFRDSVVRQNRDFEFFVLLMQIYIILWQLQGVSRETYRLGFYFGYFMIVSIPILIKGIKRSSNRLIVLCILTGIMCIFYVDYFVIHLYNETYPYSSMILGI